MNLKNGVALYTIVRKEIVRFMRIWSQTLLPPAITAALYFMIFGKLIGSHLNNIHGYSYIEYIVPGLTMMSIMTHAYANTSTSFFGAKFSKSIEEMLVSSMPNSIILLGYMLGGTLRGIVVGVIVMLVALLFVPLHIHSIPIVIVMTILAAMLFSLAGLINGIFAKRFDDVAFIPTFILTPLTYLGGVFFSITQLPAVWQKIALLNPILNIVDTFRFGIVGISDVNISYGIRLTCFLFIILFIGCLVILQKGVGLRS